MCGDRVAVADRDALDRGLERRVLEGLHLAAVVAHEVVVVIASRTNRLEAGDAVSELDPLDELELREPVEGPVHACDPDADAARAQALVDLLGREAAVLVVEVLDDLTACAAGPPARSPKPPEGRLGPCALHVDNDNRSQVRGTVRCVRAVLSTILLALAAVGSACGGSDAARGPSVVAAFYPLAWATEQVADASHEVVNVTPAGAEPHDLELSPRDVETIRDAELVVYVGGGFQSAIEDAVDSRDGPSLDLLREGEDPHIWLDPLRFSDAVSRIALELGARESAGATLRSLEELDRQYRRGLADCDRRVIVTTHASFGRLADRYGLTELPLAGRSPEVEPGPRDLERIIDEVRASGATTVFAEPLVSSRLAETVAREAGVEVATLDPIEGLSKERLAAGEDYLSVMRGNLETLRGALGCS